MPTTFIPASDWCPFVGHSPNEANVHSINKDDSSHRLSIIVPHASLSSAVDAILGWDYVQDPLQDGHYTPGTSTDATGPAGADGTWTGTQRPFLVRQKPLAYPWDDRIAAFAESIEYFGQSTKNSVMEAPLNSALPPNYIYPYYRLVVTFRPKRFYYFPTEAQFVTFNSFLASNQADQLTCVQLNGVTYTSRPEWWRNTIIEGDSYAESLNFDVSQLQYTESTTGATVPELGGCISTPFGIIESRGALKVTWCDVPHTYIFNLAGLASGFARCLGKVNKYTFYGNPPQTLGLFDKPVFIQKPQPLLPDASIYAIDNVKYDVIIIFRQFDPPRGATSPIKRGHNVRPVKGKTTYLSANRIKYDANPSISTVDLSQPYLYPEQDFASIFAYNGPGMTP